MNINLEMAQYFVSKKIIKKQQVEQLLLEAKEHNLPFNEYLVYARICSNIVAMKTLEGFYSMPFIEVDMLKIDKEFLKQFSFDFIKKHKILPVMIDENGEALFAISNPYNFIGISAIGSYFYGAKCDFVLSPEKQILQFIESVNAKESTSIALDALDKESSSENVIHVKDEDEEDVVKNTPAVRLIDSIIKEAITIRASDIHIEPTEKQVKVRYRVDGDLNERASFSNEFYPAVCARLKIMSGINIAERRIPQDGRFHTNVNNLDYDFRVSTLPTVYGEKFVVRILDKSSFNFTRKELGFSDDDNQILDKVLSHPHGIVLLTGPTGCGKSTTLYSFLKQLNKPTKNIITVEDPVEYTMDGINQTQVNTKANMTFANALRSILRQDPDIIMIGEIRDAETAQIAVRAAITGHLVLSTLHTNDAPGAISRLLDMGISSYLVADALVCVISQRLVKKLCPVCKRRSRTTQKEMEILGIDEPMTIYRPVGCQFCNNIGYKGRLAVLEIMYIDELLRNAINNETTMEDLRKLAEQNGMKDISASCFCHLKDGTTSLSELLAVKID